MGFIIGLPKNFQRHDSIMVIVDKLSKVAHFIPIKYTYKDVNIAYIFMKQIFRLHGVVEVIASDIEKKFIVNLWKALFKGVGTQLNFSTAYYPQIYG